MREISREIYQELHRGLLLTFPMKSVRNQKENEGTRSSTEDFCLSSLSKVYEISKEIDQELHRRLLLIVLIESV